MCVSNYMAVSISSLKVIMVSFSSYHNRNLYISNGFLHPNIADAKGTDRISDLDYSTLYSPLI